MDQIQVKVARGGIISPYLKFATTAFEFQADWNERAVFQDMNKDGILDIVFVAKDIDLYALKSGSVLWKRSGIYIKYGLANGTFSAATRFKLSYDIVSDTFFGPHFAVDDFDGNGSFEVLSTSYFGPKLWVSEPFPYIFQIYLFK